MDLVSLIFSILGCALSAIGILLSWLFWRKTYKEVVQLRLIKRVYNVKMSKRGNFIKISSLAQKMLENNPDFDGLPFKDDSRLAKGEISKHDVITAMVNMYVNIEKSKMMTENPNEQNNLTE